MFYRTPQIWISPGPCIFDRSCFICIYSAEIQLYVIDCIPCPPKDRITILHNMHIRFNYFQILQLSAVTTITDVNYFSDIAYMAHSILYLSPRIGKLRPSRGLGAHAVDLRWSRPAACAWPRAQLGAELWHLQLADPQKEGLLICRIKYTIQYSSY